MSFKIPNCRFYRVGAVYLIDDRDGHGATDFGDRHIQIGTEPRFPDWASVLDYFKA